MSKQWSGYQKDIFEEVVHGVGHVVVNAGAGTGKTTTIVEAATRLPKKLDVICVAFNNHIVKELASRLPETVAVSTLHSFGWRSLRRHYGSHIILEKDKVFKTIGPLMSEWNIPKKQRNGYAFRLSKIVDLMRLTLCEPDIQHVTELAAHHDFLFEEEEAEHAIEVLKLIKGDRNLFDFTDMIYQVVLNQKVKVTRYDVVFVDECQDLNRAQQELLFRMLKPNGRFIAVGDPNQCQPTGTLVRLTNGIEIPIENINIGDEVTSFKESKFLGWNKHYEQRNNQKCVVEKIGIREYNGKMFEMTSNGKISRYTPNHHCLVKFRPECINDQNYVLYLMQEGDWFRIGITNLWRDSGFGLGCRARGERVDKAWILQVFSTKSEAFVAEQFYSAYFGIPQVCFLRMRHQETSAQKTRQHLTTHSVSQLFNKFGKKLIVRGIKCLQYFGRSYSHPMYKHGWSNYFGRTNVNEIAAANVIPEIMQVVHYVEGQHKPEIHNIDSWKIKEYNGTVYSLQISKHKTYVADGIATHNCIYGFAGADVMGFQRFASMPNTKQLPLSVCYRCGSDIVELAQELVPSLEVAPGAKTGIVRFGCSTELEQGDWVLCRNTKPLVKLCLELIRAKRKATIKGRDYGRELIHLMKRTGTDNCEIATIKLRGELEKLFQKLKKWKVINPTLTQSYTNLLEKVEIIEEIVFAEVSSVKAGIKLIETIFTEDISAIILSTIHKAKGFENDRIFVVHAELMPSRYAVQEWQLIQEKNLEYVLITRAKSELVYLRESL